MNCVIFEADLVIEEFVRHEKRRKQEIKLSGGGMGARRWLTSSLYNLEAVNSLSLSRVPLFWALQLDIDGARPP